jgi:hypothetical protein
MKTWVYIDHFKGDARSWEALRVGKTLGNVSALYSAQAWTALPNPRSNTARMKSCWRMTLV